MSSSKKLCMVCGDKALGYNFNAITCESCKAFFRRNALLSKKFTCPFNENCEITVVTRRFCQRCRLKKCFKIGMKKEHIMSEEEKIKKKVKIQQNRAKRKLVSSTEDVSNVSNNNNNNELKPNTIIDSGLEGATVRNDDDDDDDDDEERRTLFKKNMKNNWMKMEISSLESQDKREFDYIPPTYSTLSSGDIVHLITKASENSMQIINQIIATKDEAIEMITKILSSSADAKKLVKHFIEYPSGAISILEKLMNCKLDTITVLMKLMSAPNETKDILEKISTSPYIILELIEYLMKTPEEAKDIAEKLISTPVDAISKINNLMKIKGSEIMDEETCPNPNHNYSMISSMLNNSAPSPGYSATYYSEDNSPTISSPTNGPFPKNEEPLKIDLSMTTATSMESTIIPNDIDEMPALSSTTLKTSMIKPALEMAIENEEDHTTSLATAAVLENPLLSTVPVTLSALSAISSNLTITNMRQIEDDETKNILEDIEDKPIQPNSLESVLCEAIKLEYETFNSIPQTFGDSRELNEAEHARLSELILASKALYLPVDEDLTSLINGDERIKCESSQQDPTLLKLINLTAVAIKRLIKMSKKIGAFRNLCQEDQIALLKGGCTEMMIMRSVMSYDCDHATWKIPHRKENMSNIKVDVLKLAKGNVYEEHERFIQTFEPKWRMDENIILILCAILLFTPTRSKVLHSDVIKLEQNSYYYLLRRYLESVYPGCEAKLTFIKLIQKISEVERLNNVVIGVYLNVNPSQVEPLLIEIFDLKSH